MDRKYLIDRLIDLEGCSFNSNLIMYKSDKELLEYVFGVAFNYKNELESYYDEECLNE